MVAILKRLLELIPTLLGISILTFFLMRTTKGDPVKMRLGPEATQEAIDAEYVKLGFKYYRGGDDATLIVEESEDTLRFLVPETDIGTSEEGVDIRIHIPDRNVPVKVTSSIDESGRLILLPELVFTAAETGETIEVLVDRELVTRSLIVQYFRWLGGILTLDWGKSITTERPVWDEITSRLLATFELAVVAMFFATLTGMIIGILSAVYPRSLLDNVSRITVFVFLAMPSFWLGLELIIIFARYLEWFPPAGRPEAFSLSYMFLPALTLGVGTGAFLSRILRSSMLEVLSTDYVRTARAKGVSEWNVIIKHAFRNALIPFLTVSGLSLGALLGGSVIVETVFSWPGIGKLLIDSIHERNFPVTMGVVLVLATTFVLVNLLVDILYVVIDPRIRLDNAGSN